jgi:prepilin-type N-terminal cleavage/methylation domain-containing protein
LVHRQGFSLVELIIVVVIIGILALIAIPNYSRMQTHAREASVRNSAHSLQLAAEDFALLNDGLFALDLGETTPDGRTIVDLLPGTGGLTNPFTGVREVPGGNPPTEPGQIGYGPNPLLGAREGYEIQGMGREEIVVVLRR